MLKRLAIVFFIVTISAGLFAQSVDQKTEDRSHSETDDLILPSSLEFGAWQNRSENITYKAETDGFVIVRLVAQNNGRGYIHFYTDRKQNPTALRASASVHYYRAGDVWVPYDSFMVPVKKGHYYKTNYRATNDPVSVSMFWIGLK